MSTPVATVPLTYNLFVTQLANMAVVQTQTVGGIVSGVDAEFNVLIPQALDYAELRIQRDMDLLPLQTSNSYTLMAGNNLFSISVNDFVTTQTFSINGNPLLPVSKEFLQNVYGAGVTLGQPQFYAPIGGDLATAGNTSNMFMLGPWPDSNYPVTVFGTQRMPSLYLNSTDPTAAETNTTFISTWLPDMLMQAAMIVISQFQRNWGSASNSPDMGPTFEAVYQGLLASAKGEEFRKRYEASGWSSMPSSPVATPAR